MLSTFNASIVVCFMYLRSLLTKMNFNWVFLILFFTNVRGNNTYLGLLISCIGLMIQYHEPRATQSLTDPLAFMFDAMVVVNRIRQSDWWNGHNLITISIANWNCYGIKSEQKQVQAVNKNAARADTIKIRLHLHLCRSIRACRIKKRLFIDVLLFWCNLWWLGCYVTFDDDAFACNLVPYNIKNKNSSKNH